MTTKAIFVGTIENIESKTIVDLRFKHFNVNNDLYKNNAYTISSMDLGVKLKLIYFYIYVTTN